MARLTQLADVLFPVDQYPVFAAVRDGSTDRLLPVPDRKAIVNTKNGRVLGVVGRGYRLVTNRDALEMALECCQAAFPETKPGEWNATAADAPGTASYCQIDLTHNSTVLDFSVVPAAGRPEAFGPFIRVTNSYNGLRALAFDIGFFRKVCRNGLILRDSIIHFEFVHSRHDIGAKIRFDIAHNQLAKLKAGFGNLLSPLRECSVPRALFGPLVFGILRLRPPKNLESDVHVTEDWFSLTDYLDKIEARYCEGLGDNAYAVLNTVTEFASHPPSNRCVHRDRHSMQQLAGTWVSEFSQQCRRADFNLTEYVTALAGSPTEVGP